MVSTVTYKMWGALRAACATQFRSLRRPRPTMLLLFVLSLPFPKPFPWVSEHPWKLVPCLLEDGLVFRDLTQMAVMTTKGSSTPLSINALA